MYCIKLSIIIILINYFYLVVGSTIGEQVGKMVRKTVGKMINRMELILC